MENHPLDKVFSAASQKVMENAPLPDPKIWEQLDSRLDEKQKKRGIFWLNTSKVAWYAAAASVLIVAGCFYFFKFSKVETVAHIKFNGKPSNSLENRELSLQKDSKIREIEAAVVATVVNKIGKLSPVLSVPQDTIVPNQQVATSVIPASIHEPNSLAMDHDTIVKQAVMIAKAEEEDFVEIEIIKTKEVPAGVQEEEQIEKKHKSLLLKLNDLRKGRSEIPLQSNSKSIVERFTRE